MPRPDIGKFVPGSNLKQTDRRFVEYVYKGQPGLDTLINQYAKYCADFRRIRNNLRHGDKWTWPVQPLDSCAIMPTNNTVKGANLWDYYGFIEKHEKDINDRYKEYLTQLQK